MPDTEERTSRSQMVKHEDAYNWLVEQGHINAKSSGPEVIAAFAARRNEYRRTDRYRNLVDGIASSREAQAAERAQAREAAKAEKAAAAEKAKADKAAAAKAKPAKTAAKATKATAKASKASASDDNPFE
jgi:hypothetical protein